MSYSGKSCFILLLLLTITSLIYINGLKNPFTPDDYHIIVENFLPRPDWTIADMFRLSLFPSYGRDTAYYRPLTLLTFAGNYDFFGDQPWGYRAVNIGIHLVVVALAFCLFHKLARPWIAVFATLIFAVHPANVQAITYISSRGELLYTAFVLLCVHLWRLGNDSAGPRRNVCFGLAPVAFFLGLLSKETAVVAPPLVFALDVLSSRAASLRQIVKEKLIWYFGFVVALALYIFIRVGAGYPLLMERDWDISFPSRIFFALKLFAQYLGVAFFPVHLSAFRVVDIPDRFFEAPVLMGAALLVAVALLAWRHAFQRREIAYGLVLFLLAILPALNLTKLNAPMMEHWLYLPLIGLGLAFAGIVHVLAERFNEIRGASLGLVLLCLLLAIRTVNRNAEWGDLTALFSRDVTHYPNHHRAWAWLGGAYRIQGDSRNAILAFRRSLQVNPAVVQNWVGLGIALSMAGEDPEAERILSAAAAKEPGNPWNQYYLALHLLKTGKNGEAASVLESSTKLQPRLPLSYHALGSAYLRLKQPEKAEAAFQAGSRQGSNRSHAGFHLELGRLYAEQGRTAEAAEEWRVALRFEPANSQAQDLLRKLSP